ncbi:hypothetical protein [Ralstonia solanacearum]|uniref:hypothetical protein n=1 Tax=Ralstonia solanacearum TaxID=305 RepID=UPI0018D14CB7|nr:hypothetical protein [Ralstonia solanacearum]
MNTEISELDRPLFILAALRGYRLQRMPDGYYALFKRNGDDIDEVARGLTVKNVSNRCGAIGKTTLRQSVERDGLKWPETYEAFLALVRTV